MYIASFGHQYMKEIRLKLTDVYIDIRDDYPKMTPETKKFGIDKKLQKQYFSMEGVKKYYKKKIRKKIRKKIKSRKNSHWRVFIGDNLGRLESVMLAERLEHDMIKKYKVYPTIEHLTLTAGM